MTWRQYAKSLFDVIFEGYPDEAFQQITHSSDIFEEIDRLHPGFQLLDWDADVTHWSALTTKLTFTELLCKEIRAFLAAEPTEQITQRV